LGARFEDHSRLERAEKSNTIIVSADPRGEIARSFSWIPHTFEKKLGIVLFFQAFSLKGHIHV
jgi:hypothetical protein